MSQSITAQFCSAFLVLFTAQATCFSQANVADQDPYIVEQIEIDSVWVANKVSFDLHTVGNLQFVAYYDQNRMMTIASRELSSSSWEKKTLSSQLMWDSHNYVALGIDDQGYIHVSGNMHTNPLNYYRSTKPYDVQTIVEVDSMTAIDEESVTYPKFFNSKTGELLFSYRSGTCGNGNILLNQFDAASGTWQRYLDKPLFEGIGKEDQRAAYHKFVRDSEGNFHFIWMWRWTPLVETSHQICYATTHDLIHWKNAAGKESSLPFRPGNKDLIVDATPSLGGMHNSRYQIYLTKDQDPVIGYIKYDDAGLTQLFLATHTDGKWHSRQISDWNFRWKFVGGGDQMTMGGKFSFNGQTSEGHLVIDWVNETGNSGQYLLDPSSLEHIDREVRTIKKYPEGIDDRLTDHPEMSVNLQQDKGIPLEGNTHYLLKWESMKKSHGKHAPAIIPKGPISKLIVVKYRS